MINSLTEIIFPPLARISSPHSRTTWYVLLIDHASKNDGKTKRYGRSRGVKHCIEHSSFWTAESQESCAKWDLNHDEQLKTLSSPVWFNASISFMLHDIASHLTPNYIDSVIWLSSLSWPMHHRSCSSAGPWPEAKTQVSRRRCYTPGNKWRKTCWTWAQQTMLWWDWRLKWCPGKY